MSMTKKAEVTVMPSAATPAQTADPILSLIERAAKDPQVDIAKMERLFEMHQKMQARQAEMAFNAAMAAAQAELIPVARKLWNPQTKSMYADLAAITEEAMPIIHKHGFATICSEFKSQEPNCVGIACKALHSGGHSERYEFNIPLDGAGIKGNANKTPTHAYASTVTYGRRYAQCSVFNIVTKKDTDGNSSGASDFITGQQAEELSILISETKIDIAKFLAIGNLESLSDMPANQFASAKRMLLAKRDQVKSQ
jgi:hypothetical protein